jgi:hypothetical protein
MDFNCPKGHIIEGVVPSQLKGGGAFRRCGLVEGS